MNWYRHPESWSFILRRYLPRLTLCSLAWEIIQLPLYTLRSEPRLSRIAYMIIHCTVGDAMIGIAALVLALILLRAGERENWPETRISMLLVFLTVAYTIPSESINLARGDWAYSSWMPVLPWLDVGLAPVAQWIVVPLVAWWWACRRSPHARRRK